MTKVLSTGEMVYIIAYNEEEKAQIEIELEEANVDLSAVDFYIYPTDDVWIRDNGPNFVYERNNQMVMMNWRFNGWKKRQPIKSVPKFQSTLVKI
jgi:agmatine deiminase